MSVSLNSLSANAHVYKLNSRSVEIDELPTLSASTQGFVQRRCRIFLPSFKQDLTAPVQEVLTGRSQLLQKQGREHVVLLRTSLLVVCVVGVVFAALFFGFPEIALLAAISGILLGCGIFVSLKQKETKILENQPRETVYDPQGDIQNSLQTAYGFYQQGTIQQALDQVEEFEKQAKVVQDRFLLQPIGTSKHQQKIHHLKTLRRYKSTLYEKRCIQKEAAERETARKELKAYIEFFKQFSL